MMWKIYAVLSLVLFCAAIWDWRQSAQREWVYAASYYFAGGGSGRIFIKRSSPIATQDDLLSVEKWIVDENERIGNGKLANLYVASLMQLAPPR